MSPGKEFCQYLSVMKKPGIELEDISRVPRANIIRGANRNFAVNGEKRARSFLFEFAHFYLAEHEAAQSWADEFYRQHENEIEGRE